MREAAEDEDWADGEGVEFGRGRGGRGLLRDGDCGGARSECFAERVEWEVEFLVTRDSG